MTLSVDIHKPAGLPEGEALQPSAREKLSEGAVEAAVPAVPEQVSNAKDRAVDDGAEAATCGQTPDLRESDSSSLTAGSTALVSQPTLRGGMARYEAARRALAETHRVDEVKEIRDKAIAMAEYARQAKDAELIWYATEIRLRAERRAGEMLAEMAQRGERDNGRGNRNPALKSQAATPKLADLGINKSQSSKWQRLASLSGEEFERKVEQTKTNALSAIDRTAKPARVNHDAADGDNDAVRAVRRAVKILCAVGSAKQVAAAMKGIPEVIAASDLVRAIKFLEELKMALSGPTADHSGRSSIYDPSSTRAHAAGKLGGAHDEEKGQCLKNLSTTSQ